MRSCPKDNAARHRSEPGHDRHGGFTMIELLLALAIGAAVITAGVMIFQSLTAGARPSGSYVNITLGTTVMQNFYGLNQASIDAWIAPNYGQRAQADMLRDRLWEDLEKANAVYCLGRADGVLNTTHPQTITVPATFRGQNYDLPEAFRLLLADAIPASGPTFTAYRGASTARNLTIFILEPSDDVTLLSVRAVYDIDLVATTSSLGNGTYVSGRRYEGGTLTDFYDVFYLTDGTDPTPPTIPFNPLAVAFERSVRPSEGNAAVDRIKVAEQRPFYFVWWPDPAMPYLEAFLGGNFGAADPRSAYPNMGGRTSLFFTIPMFPAL